MATDTWVNRKSTLERATFTTSRLLDFCNDKELTAQTGHERAVWPLVILKELLDNSLDACEEAALPPRITVSVESDKITVADNGPGMSADTVRGILDFAVRVSSREAYTSPTRGAQGNALKCVLAIPFVLDGQRGRVDIETRGQRHEITFGVDPIRQSPVVSLESPGTQNVKNGTAVRVWWPDSACSELADAEAQFLQLASDYTLLNPHLALSVDWQGRKSITKATNPKWSKWLPSEPTSPHWYRPADLERLICAYIGHDQDRGTDRSVREFVKEFRGLTGTAKQKIVLEASGLSRTRLPELANGEGVNSDLIGSLLRAMQEHSKPVKPAALGVIGKDHLARRFKELGVVMESFDYKRVFDRDEDGLPVVIETAFGWRGEDCEEERRIVTGVNWSPGIVNPFRELGSSYGDGLAALLEKRYAGRTEPIVFFLHCACPRVRYTDRGKSAVVIE